jgi:CxxC motif-containing protein (DUF1111 family)
VASRTRATSIATACLWCAAICITLAASSSLRARAQRSTFPLDAGHRLFVKSWSAADGLGPLANALSCAACHSSPRTGGGGGSNRDAMVLVTDEERDPTGGHLFRRLLIRPGRAVVTRPLPRRAFRRRAPSLLGVGFLERLPAAAIAAAADPEDRDGDRISGRVPNGAGRFTWKARFPTLEGAVAAALVNELGLTTSADINRADGSEVAEISREQLAALTAYVRQLAPPTPKAHAATGESLFVATGCAACHVPQIAQVPGSPQVRPYTDLLLHDMGPALADGLAEDDASAAEFRTPPLWGIRSAGPPFLHDGRAPTLDRAIRLHGGEAEGARSRYERLSVAARRALIEFLNSI